MNRKIRRTYFVTFLCLLTLGIVGETDTAAQQSVAKQATGKQTNPKAELKLKELLGRLQQVERQAAQFREKTGVAAAKSNSSQYPVLIETPYIGITYNRSSQAARFFVVRLLLGNPTSKPVVVHREKIILEADDDAFQANDVPSNIQNQGFQVGQKGYSLRNLKSPKQLTIPAESTSSMWVIFTGLPQDNDIPRLILKIQIGEKEQKLDINEQALGLLKLGVERIGPRDCLALLTISGMLNSINVGSLVDEMDRLVTKNVARVIVRWDKSARPVDSNLMNWLSQVAMQAGRGEVRNTQYPAVPVTVRELHLAELAGGNSVSSYYTRNNRSAGTHIHKTTNEAIIAALRTAYEVLPRDELLKEIQHGDPLTQAAALAIGGGRLSNDQLPIILKYADDKNEQQQKAALIALKHFGNPESIDKLISYVRKDVNPLSEVAVESLAASRYAVAHKALLDILKNDPPKSRKMIVTVLARHPRPIWSDTLYEFTKDANATVSVEALRGLVRVGHPRLFEVLKNSLESSNQSISSAAFQLLVTKSEPRFEELALEYALEYLKKSPPNSQIVELLNRTRDRRAVPLLLKHLAAPKKNGNRSTTINLLAQIGDETVVAALVGRYPKLQKYEKTAVLNALIQMRSREFIRLAGPAISSKDSSLVSVACQGLQADGSPHAIKLLVDALEKSTNQPTWSYVCNALAVVATPEARDALKKARESKNANKKNYAVNALRNLRQRSPGYQYVYQGQHYARQKDWKTAVIQYSMALKIDPSLSDAYSGRANAHLKLEKIDEARKDFSKAVELDSYNSQAMTGLAVVMVLQGQYEQGIKSVENMPERFKTDMLYAYNTACVYGRAVEHLQKNETIKDRAPKIKAYQAKAITELKRAVKLGFRDFNWMRKDPDLKSLHNLTGFKQIHSPTGNNRAEKK